MTRFIRPDEYGRFAWGNGVVTLTFGAYSNSPVRLLGLSGRGMRKSGPTQRRARPIVELLDPSSGDERQPVAVDGDRGRQMPAVRLRARRRTGGRRRRGSGRRRGCPGRCRDRAATAPSSSGDRPVRVVRRPASDRPHGRRDAGAADGRGDAGPSGPGARPRHHRDHGVRGLPRAVRGAYVHAGRVRPAARHRGGVVAQPHAADGRERRRRRAYAADVGRLGMGRRERLARRAVARHRIAGPQLRHQPRHVQLARGATVPLHLEHRTASARRRARGVFRVHGRAGVQRDVADRAQRPLGVGDRRGRSRTARRLLRPGERRSSVVHGPPRRPVHQRAGLLLHRGGATGSGRWPR